MERKQSKYECNKLPHTPANTTNSHAHRCSKNGEEYVKLTPSIVDVDKYSLSTCAYESGFSFTVNDGDVSPVEIRKLSTPAV